MPLRVARRRKVFRRKTTSRSYGGRRVPIRRTRAPVKRRNLGYSKPYYFKRTITGSLNPDIGGDYYTQGPAGAAGWQGVDSHQINFRLSDLPNYTEFTNLFNEYKLMKVVIKFTPSAVGMVSNASDSTQVATPGGVFGTVINKTGFPTATPTDLQSFEQYQTFKCQSVWSKKPHVRVIRPTLLNDVYMAGGSDAYAVMKPGVWLSSMYAAAVHYGIIYVLSDISGTNIGPAQTYWIQMTYYIACRNVT